MLTAASSFASWTNDLTAMLHQVSCNGSAGTGSPGSAGSFLSCADQCGLIFTGYDHLCTVERVNGSSAVGAGAADSSSITSTTLLCRPCDYFAAGCDVNVSLVLNGLESIEGAFLSRIPRFTDCNSSLIGEVSPSYEKFIPFFINNNYVRFINVN